MLFGSPEPDQREAPGTSKFFCLSLLRKVLILGLISGLILCLILGLILTFGAGSDHRSPTNGRRGVLVSCGVPWMEALEEFALGTLHVQSSFGVGLGLGEVI